MEKLLVTVVIATHNRASLLIRAINSILTQTFQDFEIIIVNDSSIDNTYEVIERLRESDPRINAFHSGHNIGPGAARNLGIKQANGEYIAILDDDDIAKPDRLEIQVKELQSDTNLGLVFSSVEFIDDKMKSFEISPNLVYQGNFPTDTDEIFRLLYVERNYIPNTTIMTRKTIWQKFSYPEEPWIGEDRFLFCQLAASGIKIKAISQPLVMVRRVPNMRSLAINNKDNNYRRSIEVVKMIKRWLKNEKIVKFDHYYKQAISNRLLIGSEQTSGILPFFLLIFSYLYNPNNPKTIKNIRKYLKSIIDISPVNGHCV